MHHSGTQHEEIQEHNIKKKLGSLAHIQHSTNDIATTPAISQYGSLGIKSH